MKTVLVWSCLHPTHNLCFKTNLCFYIIVKTNNNLVFGFKRFTEHVSIKIGWISIGVRTWSIVCCFTGRMSPCLLVSPPYIRLMRFLIVLIGSWCCVVSLEDQDKIEDCLKSCYNLAPGHLIYPSDNARINNQQ